MQSSEDSGKVGEKTSSRATGSSLSNEIEISFRPNYSKKKGTSQVTSVLASSVTGHNYKRLTYDRDLVMSLRSTKNAVPPASFLQGLNAEEKMLVLSGAGMQDEEETLFEADVVLPERETDSKEEYVASEEGSSDNEHRAKLPKPGIGAWIAPSAIGNLGMSRESKVVGRAKGILNKLTRSTFAKLSTEFVSLVNGHAEQLEDFVSIIFDKVCLEPTFCPMYAQLFLRIVNEYRSPQEQDARRQVLMVLLKKCQMEFQSNERADLEREKYRAEKASVREKNMAVMEGKMAGESGGVGGKDVMMESEIEQRHRLKKLGNTMLIAELFCLKLVPEKVIHNCVIYLVRNIKDPMEEDIEHLCKLLTIAGKEVDTPRAKSYVDQYFVRISKLSQCKALPSRLRFMLQDVIELRASGWTGIPRPIPSSGSTLFELSPIVSSKSSLSYQGDVLEAVLLSSGEIARIKQEMRFIVEEYVVSEDVEEVVQAFSELRLTDSKIEFRSIFIYLSMIFSMERGDREHRLILKAFVQLHKALLLTPTDFIKAWSKLIEELEEIENDIMFVRSYLSDFIVSAIKAGIVSKAQFGILLERHKTENCKAVCESVLDQL